VNRLENTERNIENPKNGVRECEGLVCGPGDRLVKRQVNFEPPRIT
jgi:hypothetical protein